MYNLPKWSGEFVKFLSVTPQFIFKGNILDVYPLDLNGNITTLKLIDYIRTILVQEGYEIILELEPYIGFTHLHGDTDTIHAVLGDVLTAEKTETLSIDSISSAISKSIGNRTVYSAIILNQILHYDMTEREKGRLFYHLFRDCLHAEPRLLAGSSIPRYNLLIWINDDQSSFPTWYTENNTRIRVIEIPKPDREVRRILLESLSKTLEGYSYTDKKAQEETLRHFIDKTRNFHANEIISLVSLIKREILPASDISDAIAQFSSGFSENPWKKLNPDKIRQIKEDLSRCIYGQGTALLDISSLILNRYFNNRGVQFRNGSSSPKNLFLFAGPGGSGKRTTIHGLMEMLSVPDESLFTINCADHQGFCRTDSNAGTGCYSSQRLFTHVHQNPYAFLLFESIESADPPILDMVTKMVRDGVIVTNDGDRISFSYCTIMCTTDPYHYYRYETNTTYHRELNQQSKPGTGLITAESIITFFEKREFDDFIQHFRESIVIFDPIDPDIARQILQNMITRMTNAVKSAYGVQILLNPSVQSAIEEMCARDLSRGGTGIGDAFERVLIRPLSRALAELSLTPDEKVIISQVSDNESGWEVLLSRV